MNESDKCYCAECSELITKELYEADPEWPLCYKCDFENDPT